MPKNFLSLPKRLLLLGGASLALISGTPRTALDLPAVATTDPADLDRAILSATWGEVSTLTFNAGFSDVQTLAVKITGEGLRATASGGCRADQQAVLCTVPRLPAGQNFGLRLRGANLSVVATFRRVSSQHTLSMHQ